MTAVTSTTKLGAWTDRTSRSRRLLRPVRRVRRLDLAQPGVEGGVGHELAGAAVVGVAVVGIRGQDEPRLLAGG